MREITISELHQVSGGDPSYEEALEAAQETCEDQGGVKSFSYSSSSSVDVGGAASPRSGGRVDVGANSGTRIDFECVDSETSSEAKKN